MERKIIYDQWNIYVPSCDPGKIKKKYHADHITGNIIASDNLNQLKSHRPASSPLRDIVGALGICPLVDVRRCLFIATGGDRPSPTLFAAVPPRPFVNVGTVLVVDARGRVFDDASLGNPAPPLRAFPLGAPEARFRFLITSVFSDSGRTTPCSLKNNPHALHKGCPSGSRLHSGVFVVWQFVHDVGGWSPSSLLPFGLPALPSLVLRSGVLVADRDTVPSVGLNAEIDFLRLISWAIRFVDAIFRI